MNLLQIIHKTSVLTDFEFRRLLRQRRLEIGGIVISLLTLLMVIGVYVRRYMEMIHPPRGRSGEMHRLMDSIFNGISFSESVLLIAIYLILPMIIGIFVAVSFAGELQLGQIRTLAIRPVSRLQIYISKILSMYLLSIALLFLLLSISYMTGGFLFGWSNDLFVFNPIFFGNSFEGQPIFHIIPAAEAHYRLFLSYIFCSFTMLNLISLFIMFSVIFKKMAPAAVVPLGIYYTSWILGALPFMDEIQRFLPTRHLMIWKYTLMEHINWEIISNELVFLLAYSFAYLIIGGIRFSSSEL